MSRELSRRALMTGAAALVAAPLTPVPRAVHVVHFTEGLNDLRWSGPCDDLYGGDAAYGSHAGSAAAVAAYVAALTAAGWTVAMNTAKPQPG